MWAKNHRFISTAVSNNTLHHQASLLTIYLAMKKHADLNPPLSRIEKEGIPTSKGAVGEDYYDLEFEIHAAYFSAHCQYTLWYEGVNHGDVQVNYV